MSEFVQKHANKNEEDEDYAIDRRRHAAGTVIKPADPGEEEKERDVNFDLDPENPHDAK